MTDILKPENEDHVLDAVKWAVSNKASLEIMGQGTKRGLGRPVEAASVLDMSGLSGITLYEPEELVMTARAGTPLAEVEAALKDANQMLAFEPWSPKHIYNVEGGTVGGIFAANISGPRRILAGAARDHMLGFQAVSGRGEAFKSGGRVVKNVTGFDLTKLMAGSMGTLGVMTEISFKVLPKPEKTRTVLLMGATSEVKAMIAAQSSPYEVSGYAHLPQNITERSSVDYVKNAGQDVTAFRVEGPAPSVTVRCEALRKLLAPLGASVEELHTTNSQTLWTEIRDISFFTPQKQIWRLSVTPTEGPALAKALAGEYILDWAGGLIWLALDPTDDAEVDQVRSAIKSGHATCMRAADSVRAQIDIFQPQDVALATLNKRVRAGFDPHGIFNPGRV